MKLQLTLITTGIAACTLAGSAYTSPISSLDSAITSKSSALANRGSSERGIGHYGGIVSEISMDLAEELELEGIDAEVEPDAFQTSATSTIDTASSTVTVTPMAAAIILKLTTTDESTSWTTMTVTETIYVTQPPSTVTAAPTQTPAAPAKKAKRGEVPLQLKADVKKGDNGIFKDIEKLDKLIAEMNRFSLMDTIVAGDPCIPVTESGNKICVGNKVVVCGEKSRIWEVDLNCDAAGLDCGAVRARDLAHGGWKADIRCD